MITSPDKVTKTGIPIPPVGKPRESKWAYAFNRRAVNEAWTRYEEKCKRFYDNIEVYFREIFLFREVVGARIDFREHEIDFVLDLSNGMCLHRTLPSLFFVHDFDQDLFWCLKDAEYFIKDAYK